MTTCAPLKATPLQQGDSVALVAPGFIATDEQIHFGTERLEAMGLKVVSLLNEHHEQGYFAGSIKECVAAIHTAFSDKSIHAVIALRGGFGSARLLPHLDYELIRQNPKIVLGYSDITALLVGIYHKTGLLTFHGPNAESVWSKYTADCARRLLFDNACCSLENPAGSGDDLVQTQCRTTTICSGVASGRLLGGNLTVLLSLLGTPYFPTNWQDVILLVEDWNEPTYKIDRMLLQLQMAGVLSSIKGFVFGTTQNSQMSSYRSYNLERLIDERIVPLGIPAYRGATLGHQKQMLTFAIGAKVTLDADKKTVQLLEPALTR